MVWAGRRGRRRRRVVGRRMMLFVWREDGCVASLAGSLARTRVGWLAEGAGGWVFGGHAHARGGRRRLALDGVSGWCVWAKTQVG